MKKKSKVILSVLGGIASAGAAGVGIATTINTNNMQVTNNDVNQGNANSGNVSTTPSKPTENRPGKVETVVNGESFQFKLTKQLARSADNTETKYLLEINGNTKKEGVIYLVDGNNIQTNQLMVSPGQTITVGVTLNEGYENYTVRELKVFGADKNHFVPSKQVEGQKNLFQVTLPTIEQSTNLDGTNWLYDENTPINVIPTFIKAAVGNKVEWEHGAFYGDLNGYVYELKMDSTWSQIESDLYNQAFENEDKTDPINIYFYLNGHTLTIDKDVNGALGVKSGWCLNFYNNKYMTEDKEFGYGEVTASVAQGFNFDVKGAIGFGPSVKFKYLTTSGTAIKILPSNDNTWIGAQQNDPSKR